jgi:hypothetical protein
MSTFGGHVLDTIEALQRLSYGVEHREGAVPIYLNCQLSSSVQRCLAWEGKGKARPRAADADGPACPGGYRLLPAGSRL